jgi:ATP synthase protein I
MQPFSRAVRKASSAHVGAIFVCLFAWMVLSDIRPFWQSLMLGLFAGMINMTVTAVKTWRAGQAAVDPSVKTRGTGMLQRLLVIGFASYLTVRFPQMFVISGVLIGYFLSLLLSFLMLYRSFR